MTDQFINQTLDHFQIRRNLGEGSLGTVYQAHDTKLDLDVALQVIHPRLAGLADWSQRVQQAAQTGAKLEHPGLVAVRDFGQAQNLAYLVLELIPGKNLQQTLHDLQQRGRWMKLPDAVKLVRQLCLTAAYLHQHQQYQRDLRPNNLMIKTTPGTAGLPYQTVLTDPGILPLGQEQPLNELALLQQLDDFKERLVYLPPEYLQGQPGGPRGDVYTLGVLLYTLAVGRPPAEFASLDAARQTHASAVPAAPRSLNPEIPASLEWMILQAMAQNPAQRFAGAAALADALAAAFEATRIEALPADSINGEAVAARAANLENQPEPAAAEAAGQIWLRHPDGLLEPVQIPPAGLIIGRSSESVLQLDDSKISRHHLNVTFDGLVYYLTDLGSTNGTYLGQQRLAVQQGTLWPPDEVVYLGGYILQQTPEPLDVAEQGPLGQIHLALDPPHLTVRPGDPAHFKVTLTNEGEAPDRVALTISQIPSEWLESLPAPLSLRPDEVRSFYLTLKPPRTPQTQAGEYSLIVRAASEIEPGVTADQKATLKVEAFTEFESKVWPERGPVGQRAHIEVKNQSNTEQNFELRYQDQSDQADALNLGAAPTHLRVPAGESGKAEFRVTARRRRWFGRTELSYPFAIQVVPADGEPQTLYAEAVSRRLIPVWVAPILALFACMLLSGAVAYALGWNPLGRDELVAVTETPTPTATGTPNLTATAAVQAIASAIGQMGTAAVQTGTAVAQAIAATAQASTATAQAQAGVTPSATPATPVIPNAPTDLTLTVQSTTQLELGWVDNSNNETRFEIERKASGESFSLLQTVAPDTKSYLDANLSVGTEYCYRVRAINTIGQSAYTPEKCATTLAGQPAAPKNLTATLNTSVLQVDLKWEDKSDNETGFEVWRSVNGADFTKLTDDIDAGAQSFSDNTVAANNRYCYQVQAVNSVGLSTFSNSPCISLTAPTVPILLSVEAKSASQIDIKWEDKSDNETNFEVLRDSDPQPITTLPAGSNSYSNTTGLTSGTKYCYRVRAVNIVGRSADTVSMCDTTFSNIPHLKLVKVVDNKNLGNKTPADWTLTASGPTSLSDNGPTVENDVNPGTYTLSETPDPQGLGYTASDWSCSGGTQGTGTDAHKITLAVGQSATCTITNTFVTVSLTLVKVVINGGINGPGNWRLQAIDANNIIRLNNLGTVTGDVGPGTYTLKEISEPPSGNGYHPSPWNCTQGLIVNQPADATAQLTLDQTNFSVTCTITNTRN